MTRVLIVDDRPDVRFAFLHMLRAAGYEASEAGDGRAALDLLKREPADVVLTDLRMPGMDGLALLREVAQLKPRPRTILITGSEQTDEMLLQGAGDHGADVVLDKPVTRQLLHRTIQGLLGSARR